jgi:ribonuclease Z
MEKLLRCVFILCWLVALAVNQAHAEFKVALLGTASPQPRPDRFGPSTLIEAGAQKSS